MLLVAAGSIWMEDPLAKAGESLVTAVLNQDTTAFETFLHPNVKICNQYVEQLGGGCAFSSTKSSAQKGTAAPLYTSVKTPRNLAAGVEAADRRITSPPKAPPSSSQQMGTATATITPNCISMANVDAIALQPECNGIAEVCAATRYLFLWLQAASAIAEPHMTLEPRRVRKEGTVRGRERDARTLSRVVLTWGRPSFLLRDDCYVQDDGKILLIDRSVMPPIDPTDPQHIAERNHFLSRNECRIDSRSTKLPVLDYSFCSLQTPLDLLRVSPRAGKKHLRTPVAAAVVSTRGEDVAEAFHQDEGPQFSRVLITARNRQGEEEAYEFATNQQSKLIGMMEDKQKDQEAEQLRDLASKLPNKFEADSIRLCNNELVSLDNLMPVLRSLVVDHSLTLNWLDLSNNALQSIPADIALLPITTLYLHSNRIEKWATVQTLRTLPLLQVLTLYGNPIATKDSDYKSKVLAVLLAPNPTRKAHLKSLDFCALTPSDVHVSLAFKAFHTEERKLMIAKMEEREKSRTKQLTSPRRVAKPSSPTEPISPRVKK